MLSHSISPVIFKLGFIQVTWYALVYVIGFIVGALFLLHAIKKKEINLKKEQAYDLIVYSIIGLLVGARLFHAIFWNFSYFLANPIKLFHIWEGGLSFHGGFVGAILALLIYSKKHAVNIWRLFDILIIAGALMLPFARLANFINQEIVGTFRMITLEAI